MLDFKKFFVLDGAKFVLTIGDEGGILTYTQAGKLELRLFASLTSVNDMRNMQKILAEDIHAPIYVLVDVVDQSYVQQSLPAVSPLTINNLVKKRLERDFSPHDIKGSLFVERAKTGRKDWHYIFVSCPIAPPLSDWLQWVIELPNPFAGIYMLPVEATHFLKKLNSVFFTEKKQHKLKLFKIKEEKESIYLEGKEKSSWQLLVTHNKVGGGIRQIAFRGGKVIFTRLIATTDMMADIIAGNIEQEILNSVEYLRRLSLKENEEYDVYIIVSQEIKRSLETSKLPGSTVIILTPYEVTEKLSLNNAAAQEDKFADVVMAVSFSTQKHILPLFTPQARKLALMDHINRWSRIAAYVCFPLFLLYFAWIGYDIYSIEGRITEAEKEKRSAELRWQNFQKSNYSMEDTYKISDVVTLYKLLSGEGLTPLAVISDFGTIKGREVLVKAIDWKIKELPQKPGEPANSKPSTAMSVVFDVEFSNIGGYEELFENFSLFIERLKTKFVQYDVEYSRLPEKISFDTKNSVLPVQITITGPKEQGVKPQS